jgi:hypothetical protein
MRRLWAAAALIALVVMTSACQVGVHIEVIVDDSGSSTVTVTVQADAAVLAASPRLASDLVVDDLVTVGWDVTGPEPTEDGGLQVVLRREVADLAGLAGVLAEIGPPLRAVEVQRADEFARTTWLFTGRSVVSDGSAEFLDADGLLLLGAAPFMTDLSDLGRDLGDVLSMQFRLRLPGDMVRTSGTTTGDTIEWRLPMDGTLVTLEAFSERTDRGATVARTAADVARFVLVVWALVGATFVVWVLFARRRRRSRHLRATPPA